MLVDPSGPLLAGSSVTLTCRTAANPAADYFTWYRADAETEEIVGFESDFTFNVTKLSEDKYSCEAANVHGGENSEPVSINVTCEFPFLVILIIVRLRFCHNRFQTLS